MNKLSKIVVIGIILLLVLLVGVRALTPIFIGQVTRGFFFGGNIPDCSIVGYPMGPLRPFLGESITANIVENSQNLPVINALGGNPVGEMERCTPNGNLIELGCSAGYFGQNNIQDDYVGAIEYTPYDVDPNGNVRCEQYKTYSGVPQGAYNPVVLLKPAFFHPIYPGFIYTNLSIPGPIVNLTLNCPSVTVTATPSSSPYRQISSIWVEGPAPYQTGQNMVLMGNGCLQGQVCNITAAIPASGTYHSYVSEYDPVTSNYILSVDSFYC